MSFQPWASRHVDPAHPALLRLRERPVHRHGARVPLRGRRQARAPVERSAEQRQQGGRYSRYSRFRRNGERRNPSRLGPGCRGRGGNVQGRRHLDTRCRGRTRSRHHGRSSPSEVPLEFQKPQRSLADRVGACVADGGTRGAPPEGQQQQQQVAEKCRASSDRDDEDEEAAREGRNHDTPRRAGYSFFVEVRVVVFPAAAKEPEGSGVGAGRAACRALGPRSRRRDAAGPFGGQSSDSGHLRRRIETQL